MDAKDKIDFWDAFKDAMLITGGLAYAVAMFYVLAYFDVMDFGLLRDIPFVFVVFSMLIVFNISFIAATTDQLLS